ncbi:MAG: peptide deformylase [Trebonia sp.]
MTATAPPPAPSRSTTRATPQRLSGASPARTRKTSSQAIALADTTGNPGQYHPARVPRRRPKPNRRPAGLTPRARWRGLVPRPLHIEVACTKPDGQQYVLALDNAMARRTAHEIDHLAGQLYVSRMRDGVRPVPVSEYRGTGHTWTYPAPGQTPAGTQTA